MSERATQILEDALQLPPTERATVAELLSSLDRPDPQLDPLWAKKRRLVLLRTKPETCRHSLRKTCSQSWSKRESALPCCCPFRAP